MKVAVLLALTLVLGGCEGRQSVLSPAGRDAEVLANLFWWMLGGAVVLWVMVNGLMLYFSRIGVQRHSLRAAQWFIFLGGVALPTIVLSGLLVFGLREMPKQRAPGEGLTLRVTGESWWWRVEYWPAGAERPVVSANEIRLPAGSRSEIELAANGVIHSFWIPALGGKTDMIPGRVNRMSLEPTMPGVYRGQCAEFCGLNHAKMALEAVVMTPEDFDLWLAAEARDAKTPQDPDAQRGMQVFLAQGCGGCHTVRGTSAMARVGPDLTHVGGRKSLAAGMLPMNREALAEWLRDPDSVKPGVHMPGYDHLPADDLRVLTAYLEGLT